MEEYRLANDVLPYTAVIEPSTGTQLLKVVGEVDPADLIGALVEFPHLTSLGQVYLLRRHEYLTSFHGSFGPEVVI